TVRRDVVLKPTKRGDLDARLSKDLRRAGRVLCGVEGNDHQLSIRLNIEQLPAVAAPARLRRPEHIRYLNMRAGPRKRLNNNLPHRGHDISDPLAVWGELRFRAEL